MNTTVYRAPRLSRAKALIGALLASLAIAGAVQASAPDSASAMRFDRCYSWGVLAQEADSRGDHYVAAFYYALWEACYLGRV